MRLEKGKPQTRESIVVCYQIYHDTRIIRGEQVNETVELRCAWNLPDDKYLTSTPSERPPDSGSLKLKAHDQVWITKVVSSYRSMPALRSRFFSLRPTARDLRECVLQKNHRCTKVDG